MPKIADLMRRHKFEAAVYFRWESARDAATVFDALRAKQAWLPPRALIVRLDGARIAQHQPHWIAICGSYGAILGGKPFEHWWQYLKMFDLPEHDGWKGIWELDAEERSRYERSAEFIDSFLNFEEEQSTPANTDSAPAPDQPRLPEVSAYQLQPQVKNPRFQFSIDLDAAVKQSTQPPRQLPQGPDDPDQQYFEKLIAEFRSRPQPRLASNGSYFMSGFEDACHIAASIVRWKHGFSLLKQNCSHDECEQVLLVSLQWSNEFSLSSHIVNALSRLATSRCIAQLKLLAKRQEAPNEVRESARNSLLLLGHLPEKR